MLTSSVMGFLRTLFGTTLVVSLIAAPSAARAASVPQHPVATSLRLEGASTSGVVVRQGAVPGETERIELPSS